MKPLLKRFRVSHEKALSAALLLGILVQPFMPLAAFASSPAVGDAFTFSSTGSSSWTAPEGVTSVKIRAWGAGGAGGNGEKITDAHRSGQGGGAGAYVEKTVAVNAGDVFTVAVGAGGQGIQDVVHGRVGNPGGETRVEGAGETLVAGGGQGGASYMGHGNPTGDLGAGGSATGGDVNQNGGNGAPYTEFDGNPYASKGGDAPQGGMGGERGRCGRDGTCPGSDPGSPLAQDGGFPGGGGGGSDVGQGGFGANGQVIIEVVALQVAPTPITGALSTTAPACVAPGTAMTFTASVSGDGVTSIVLEKDTNGDGVFGQDTNTPGQATSWTQAGTYTFTSNEPSSYTGTYTVQLVVNGSVLDTKSVRVATDCNGSNNGGGSQTPITGTLSTTAPSCVAAGSPIAFTASVSGDGVASIVLEKDTNGDGVFGQDTNIPGQATSWTQAGTYTFTSNEPSTYTGTYTLRLVVNGNVMDSKSVTVSANCGGGSNNGGNNGGGTVDQTTGVLSTSAPSCVATGTPIAFTAVAGGTGITSVILEKDTNGDGVFGQDTNAPAQTTSWSQPGTYTFHSNEPATYTGTYTLRLVVNGVVKDTKSVTVSANCGGGSNNGGNNGGGNNGGGGGTIPISGSLTTTSPACVAVGTQIPFTATVAGSAVTSVILEKDTNGDGVFGQDTNAPAQTTSWSQPGTYTFHSNEPATYTGTYTLRLRVNGAIMDTKSVIVAANCANVALGSFSINATSGSTSENGSTATFAVVLNSAPLADVTLGVVSSDTTEGTVGASSLTFTPSNWNVPQNIVVTGVDDSIADGNISYTVTVGPSSSVDINWNGIPAQVVSLVNFDNESAPATGGTSSGGNGGSSGGSSGGGGGTYNGPCFGYNCPAGSTVSTGSSSTVPNDVWIYIDSQNQGGDQPPAVSGPTRPALVCPSVNFITRFLRMGADNDPNEVRKLQYFLNTYEGAGLTVSGDFDAATESAVKAFQVKYTADVLAPWGVSEPTGIVYITTSEKINRIYCGDHPDYAGNESVKDILDGSVLDKPQPDNSGQFDGAIGQATSTSSNIAGVFGAFTGRIFDALRTIPLYQLLILLLLILGLVFTLQGTFKKDIKSYEAYAAFMRGLAVLSVASVLDVLNTLSFMLNPSWLDKKTGLTLNWVLGLDAVNALVFVVVAMAALFAIYGRLVKDGQDKSGAVKP